jgi:hypothetical protein
MEWFLCWVADAIASVFAVFTGNCLCGAALDIHKHIFVMNQFQPTRLQQQAIEAKLSYFLGAEEYDRLFTGFEVLRFDRNSLTVCVERADDVQRKYSWHIAIVAEVVLKRAIHFVNVVPPEERRTFQAQ